MIRLLILLALLPTIVMSQTREQIYFDTLLLTDGPSVEISTSEQVSILSWLTRYADADQISVTRGRLPHLVGVALRNMYLGASTHTTDDLYGLVLTNPRVSMWANCGASVDFMLRVFDAFNISARKVSLWNWPGYEHQTLEIYSETFNKYYFYDPLYGVVFLLPNGEPAGVDDLLEDISVYGFAGWATWRAQPVRLYGLNSTEYRESVSPVYQEYNGLNYGWAVARNYFFVVAVRREDVTHYPNTQLPGEEVARGRWTVYDNTYKTELTSEQSVYFLTEIDRTFSIARSGRDYLTAVRLR